MRRKLIITGRPEDVERYRKLRGVGRDGIDPATGAQVVYGGRKRFGVPKGAEVNPNFLNPEYRLLGGTITSVKAAGRKTAGDNPDNSMNYDAEDKLIIAGIANAKIVDRMDEVLDPVGLDAVHYLKNPIMLVDHFYASDYAVGRLTKISPEDNGVHFEAVLGDPKAAPLTNRQKDTRSLVAQRILQTVSVGFIPKKIQAPVFNDEGALLEPAIIKEWELLELSIVTVPANPDSTFEARELLLNQNPAKTIKGLTHRSNQAKNKLTLTVGGKRLDVLAKQLEIEYEKEEDLWTWFFGGVKWTQKEVDATTVQTLIFDKDDFTVEEAVEWAKEHEFKADKVDDTPEDSIRLRQRAPEDFEDDSFRTIEIDTGIKAVIGTLKSDDDEDDDMDKETAKEISESLKELVTLSRDTNGKMARSIDLTEKVLGKVEGKAETEDDEEEEDEEDEDGKKLKDVVKELKATVKEQGEKIGKIAEVVEGMYKQLNPED